MMSNTAWNKGQTFTAARVFEQSDFNLFAALSGDDNPIHVDPKFAAKTHFGATVAHGMLLFTGLKGVIDRCFPGLVLIEQEFIFPNPTFVGEQVTFEIGVLEILEEHISIQTTLKKPDGSFAFEGKGKLASDYYPFEAQSYQKSGEDFKGLSVGQKVKKKRGFDPEDIRQYQQLSQTPRDYLADGQIPEPLIGGIFSDILGTQLPGRGTGWLKQHFYFHKIGLMHSEVTAQVEITRLRKEKDLVNLNTICVDEHGSLVCDGEALVLVKNLAAFL